MMKLKPAKKQELEILKVPNLRTQQGKTIAFDKISQENIQLRDAVKRRTVELEHKNRELAIESSLERVRTVAMAMKKPGDMLDVCRVISKELGGLGIKEIRNIQTAIVNEERAIYLNYEYFRVHNKTSVTTIAYKGHKETNRFVRKMLKDPEGFFTTSFKGPEVREWMKYQAQSGQFVDSYLKKAKSLHYYFYSIGPGALGISSYAPLNKEEINLFKRFRNVFRLAYQRFIDIQKAEDRAYESKIEASLEKVRAQALAMHRPADLLNVCQVLFKELLALQFTQLRNVIIHAFNDEESHFMDYDYSDFTGGFMTRIHYDAHPIVKRFIRRIRISDNAFVEFKITGKELTDWKKFRIKGGQRDDPRLNKASTIHYYVYSIGSASIGISAFEVISDEKLQLLRRFRNVFDFAYRRYMDVAQAEAQAREAEIQLSLERVRARAMAMHRSDELTETSSILFHELNRLGIHPRRSGFGIYEKDGQAIKVWLTTTSEGITETAVLGSIPLDAHPVIRANYEAWKKKKPQMFHEFTGAAVRDYYRKIGSYMSIAPQKKYPPRLIFNVYFFSEGSLNFMADEPLSDEQNQILLRFANVFDLTYRRFLDLKKAEAQAREAQIEAALERIRSRANAMHKTNELLEAAELIHKELSTLGINSMNVSYAFVDEAEKYGSYYSINPVDGRIVPIPFVFPHTETKVMRSILSSWKKQEPFNVIELNEKDTLKHQTYIGEYIRHQLVKNNIPFSVDEFLAISPKKAVLSTFNFSKGYLFNIGHEPLSKSQEELMLRFTKIFEQTYTRFLDLQKAEAQARESQIQLALERVRARALAMHKSDELSEVVAMLYKQFVELDFGLYQILISIINTDKKRIEWWSRGMGNADLPQCYYIPFVDHPFPNMQMQKWKSGEPYHAHILEGEMKKSWENYLFTQTDLKNFPGEIKKQMRSIDRVYLSDAFMKHGVLQAAGPLPLSPDKADILTRFAKVLDQAYTRMNDLQNAEAQTREAKIEAALEKVRARAMAMQKSDELQELIGTVSAELTKLDMVLDRCFIAIFDPVTRGSTWWMSAPEVNMGMVGLYMKYHESPPYLAYLEAWDERNVKWQYILEGDIKKYWDDYIFRETEFSLLPEIVKVNMKAQEKVFLNASFNAFGCLTLATLEPLSEEQSDILIRMARVFDLTYTRFNDLKQAEAQAREATIQLALERVQARAMAMQKSDELAEAAQILYQELRKLNLKAFTCGYMFIDESINKQTGWFVLPDGKMLPNFIDFPLTGDAVLDARYNDWKARKPLHVYELKGEANREHHNFLSPFVPAFVVKDIFSKVPDPLVFHCANFSDGYLFLLAGEKFSEDEQQIVIRFAKAFEVTYTRFLDLQKAEANTREAQIEVGLERVRAKAMAMHKSDDLNAAVSVVFEELAKLNLDVMRCGIGIMDKNRRHADLWVTTITGEGPVVQVSGDESFDIHPLLSGAFNAWESGKQEYSYTLKGQDLVDYYKSLGPTNFHLPESQLKLSYNASEKQYYHLATFEAGGLFAFRKDPFPDEAKDVMRRFASVFNLTYKRFLDIQRAEAQAREAQIEASLERVRAKAMAMHSSEELEATIRSFYHEIEMLSVTPRRCGVAIMDKETKIAELTTMNTTEEGETLVVMGHIKMEGHRILDEAFDHWLQQKEYHATLRGNEIKEYYKVLRPQIEFPDYPHDEVQYGYYFMFKEGDVYAWTENPLTEEQLKIYRRFTTVLSLTFKRYNDLKHAEAQAREANIEVALERVRARALAMQEPEELKDVAQVLRNEMGSLGVEELETASIYIHEKDSDTAECWYALKDPSDGGKKMVSDNFLLNLNETWVGREMKKFYLSGEKQISVVMKGTNRKEWIEYCYKHSPVFRGFYGDEIPDRTYHLYKFSHGYIGAAAPGDISAESWKLLGRAASVFSLAYSRFKDLTQARFDLLRLKEEKQRAESALTELKSTQTQLIQAEKMASLGELTAGIAHEIQNPLNFVNNFSEVSNELIAEMKEELAKGNKEEAIQLVENVKQNLDKINFHGKRADAIVKSMLQHSRKSTGQKELTDINALADEYLRLAYHGFRAKDKSFNAKFEIHLDDSIEKMNVVPQEIGRVILNLINNAFYAVSEKMKQNQRDYEPIVSVSTMKSNGHTEIKVQDNGNGMPQQVLDKIFQPFFTTKPTGQGTGLGLSLSYDIITKGHGGELKVSTREGEGTEFVIQLPS